MTQITKWSSGKKRNPSCKHREYLDGNHVQDDAVRDFLKEQVYCLDAVTQARLDTCCKLVVAAYKMRLSELAHQADEEPSLKRTPARQQSRTRFASETAPGMDYGSVKKKPEN